MVSQKVESEAGLLAVSYLGDVKRNVLRWALNDCNVGADQVMRGMLSSKFWMSKNLKKLNQSRIVVAIFHYYNAVI